MKKSGLSRLARAVCVMAVCAVVFAAAPGRAAVPMPGFALNNALGGEAVDSRSFAGKVLLISFFATWCPPCVEEVSTFIGLQSDYDKDGFSIVALSVDQGGVEPVVSLIEKRKINYPVLMADEETMEKFGGVYGIPVSFLVNRAGNVVKKYPGYVPKSILQRDIEGLLGES
ncbi:MAG: TlpA disulfide reductase family protein [Desulfopila sp.]